VLGVLADTRHATVEIGRVEHPTFAQDLMARSEDLAIADRLAAQGIGHMLDEEAAHLRMQRRGAAQRMI